MKIVGIVAILAAFVLIAIWWEDAVFGSVDGAGESGGDDAGGTNVLVTAGGALAGTLVGNAGALQSPGSFHYSQALVVYIKAREGLRTSAYYDVHGYSIGYGHFLGVSAKGSADSTRTCTVDQAEAWLQSDIKKSLGVLNQNVTVKLTQGEVDALTDFQFSTGRLATSTLLQDVNAGRTLRITNDFLQYTRAGAKQYALKAVRLEELSWTEWGVNAG